ncbi:hypothetical protein MC885_003734 [Smutsia gigantea]|nr:hypothetical protein MC885_003734 [Smutsia gigantea]
MQCLLLTLGMALLCGMQAADVLQAMGSLDLTKAAGTWHSMAMVASDITLLDSVSAPLRVYIQELRPTPEDNLEIVMSQWANHLCVQRTIMARRTEDPAVFTVDYEGERKISVLDTDYTNYMFLCMEAPVPTAEQGMVAGTWHSMAMVASDITLLDSVSAPLRVYIQELRPTPEDNLEIVTSQWEDGRCAERKILAEKTGVAAEFKINYLEENQLTVLDTDYTSYLFLCMENTAAPQQSLACQYLARTLKVDDEVMEKFGRAIKPLSMRTQLFFNPTQVEEQCRV